jgi:hypothetical protein
MSESQLSSLPTTHLYRIGRASDAMVTARVDGI